MPEQSNKPQWNTLCILSLYSLAQLLGGFTFSLLSPFYTAEAKNKGLSVTQSTLVFSSVFVVTIIFAPLFGKYLAKLGSRPLFLCGTLTTGTTTIIFGLLQWVEDGTLFFWLSLIIRILSAIGESAYFSALYPLVAQDAPTGLKSSVLSIMETAFGLGLMLGPVLGGVFYELKGFYFPFVVCGTCLLLCSFLSMIFMKKAKKAEEPEPVLPQQERNWVAKISYRKLLQMPCVFISCLLLIISEVSVSWYLPTLQPFLEDNFQMSPMLTGVLFMLEGLTYAIFSPLWGYLLDKTKRPYLLLTIGSVAVIIGYSLLGPAPYLSFLGKNVYFVAFGLVIQGIGVSATFISTLVFMMSESVAQGAPDTEQTRGMITSLWFVSENVAGWLGSSIGGVTYDQMGFENSTLIVIAMQVLALLAILYLGKCNASQHETNGEEEREKLLSKDSNGNYDSIDNVPVAKV